MLNLWCFFSVQLPKQRSRLEVYMNYFVICPHKASQQFCESWFPLVGVIWQSYPAAAFQRLFAEAVSIADNEHLDGRVGGGRINLLALLFCLLKGKSPFPSLKSCNQFLLHWYAMVVELNVPVLLMVCVGGEINPHDDILYMYLSCLSKKFR